MNIALIKFFHQAPMTGCKVDTTMCVTEAAKRGYLVSPDACTEDVLRFVLSEDYNPNSTFYRTWSDIADKDRHELLVDQILHYASTYGTDFQSEAYIPNGEPLQLNYKAYTIIEAVSEEEMYNSCLRVLAAGSALGANTLNAIIEYVIEVYGDGSRYELDLENIKNRDAQCILAKKLHQFPSSGDAIVRCLYYEVFGTPMVLMGNEMMDKLYGGKNRFGKRQGRPLIDINIDLTALTDEQVKAVSEVFLRYKRFLLALKTNRQNSHIINKMRRLSKTHHKPFRRGFWESFTNLSEAEVGERLEQELYALDNPFKIVRLMQMILLRKNQNQSRSARQFVIRNGKVWNDRDRIAPYAGWWSCVYIRLTQRLIELLKKKRAELGGDDKERVYIKFPANLELVCPVSEKQFIGNIPFGSSFSLADHDNYFGIYWRNEWGAMDFDLSFIDADGNKLGWNSRYYNENQSMVFSGDMTTANPEATEMFYIKGNKVPDGALMLNRYNGIPDSQFRLFFGQEEIKQLTKNYMVDPSGIQLSEIGTSTAQQQLVGAIKDGRVYLGSFDIAGGRVSFSDGSFFVSYMDRLRSFIPLKDVLLAAGFHRYDREAIEAGSQCHIDLTDLRKDTILNLFAI